MQALDLLRVGPLRHGVSCALLAVALLLVWSFVPHGIKALAPAGTPATVPAQPDSGRVAQRVASLHLFGESATEATAAPVAPAADIKVEGLIYADDQASALAILDVNGKSDLFKVGDALPDGEKLTAITPTAVQLTKGMAERRVEMPAQSGGPADGIALAGNTGQAPLYPGLPLPSGAQAYQPALRAVSIPQDASPLDQLRALRQQLIPQQPATAPLHPAKHPARP